MQPRVRVRKTSQQTRTGYLCLLQYFQVYGSTCLTMGRFSIVPENNHFYFHGTRQVEPFCIASNICSKWIFISFYGDIRELSRSQVYSSFQVYSLIFFTDIWSYVTPFRNWSQNDEWNSLDSSWGDRTVLGKLLWYAIMNKKKLMHSIECIQCIDVILTVTRENPQAFTREAFTYLFYFIYLFFIFVREGSGAKESSITCITSFQ